MFKAEITILELRNATMEACRKVFCDKKVMYDVYDMIENSIEDSFAEKWKEVPESGDKKSEQ